MGLLLAGCAEEEGRDASAIVGGEVSSAARNAVVRLDVPAGHCSATLIAPNLLLTARHCVSHPPAVVTNYQCSVGGDPIKPDGTPWTDADLFGDDIDPTDVVVLSGGQATTRPVASPTDGQLVHGVKLFHAADPHHCHGDIALVLLERGIDDPVTAPLRLDQGVVEGETLIASGWGYDEGTGFPTERRERTLNVIRVGPAAPDFSGDVAVPPGFFSVGEGLCAGDSGSPGLSPDGAVTGVASTLEKPGLITIQSGADCLGAQSRGHYAGLPSAKDVILAAFAESGATPWLEGTADPRAGLSAPGSACQSDADCQSNVCVPDASGGSICSQGCLGGGACPSGMECALSSGRERCVPVAPVVSPVGVTPKAKESGCAVSNVGVGEGQWGLGVVAFLGIGSARAAQRHAKVTRAKRSWNCLRNGPERRR